MALNQLSEKLDGLTNEDLGFEFDHAEVWSKLEQRLDKRKANIYWWLVAACLLVGLTVLPISLMKTTITESPALTNHTEDVIQEPVSFEQQNDLETGQKIKVEEFETPARKGIMLTQVAVVSNIKLAMEPIALPQKKVTHKPAFAAEDISIIQASLEQPSIEKGKSITVRAQLQSFPQVIQTDQKVLKIKLYEKH